MHVKLKTWNERIKTNIHGQEFSYSMYYPQVYVEKCKYTDAESKQCSMLSN